MEFLLNLKGEEMANIIDGKALSVKIKDELKIKTAVFKEKMGREVSLAVILVGEDPASQVYVRNKIKSCEYVGIKSYAFYLPKDASQEDVIETVKATANNDEIDGILVQLPLPKHIDEQKVLSYIPMEKDVDGFGAENIGNLAMNRDSIVACTPFGIMKMLKEYNIPLEGKNAVVVGRSNIVGKPIAMLLLNTNCTVTVCHSKTKNIKEITKQADILVCAIGKPNYITKDMVKDGAVVVDVGINRTENGLVGDVDFENVKELCSYITPVPGGVGPMTIAMLMENTYLCAVRRTNFEL